jgi:hypothetical protein
VDFNITDYLQLRRSAFVKYWRKNFSTVGSTVAMTNLKIAFDHLGGRFCVIISLHSLCS